MFFAVGETELDRDLEWLDEHGGGNGAERGALARRFLFPTMFLQSAKNRMVPIFRRSTRETGARVRVRRGGRGTVIASVVSISVERGCTARNDLTRARLLIGVGVERRLFDIDQIDRRRENVHWQLIACPQLVVAVEKGAVRK